MSAQQSSLSFLPTAAASSAISLYARHTEGYEERVEATIAQLREAASAHPESIVQATSLGAEDMVLTDLIARLGLPIAIGTLQTGKLHAETLALIPAIEQRYGLAVEVYAPREESVVHFVRRHGEEAMYQSIDLRKNCCEIRKLEPLSRMLDGREAWVTGLRREQSANRGGVPLREVEANGRIKFNPLADWTWNDIWHYIATHDVPHNALHDQFMPSIGCAPCTRAIAVGEEFRAGRWWWEDEKAKECGLHAVQTDRHAASGEAVAA
ncbi:phosphoadenylyl-sulfate reductase [Ideonella sp. YS5]|uniref:phosphoadenylyl-sulfate reductase n=1 Tax=Ideonella sp. YS5 TaxID=3453714 RepID=UPI003EE8DA64